MDKYTFQLSPNTPEMYITRSGDVMFISNDKPVPTIELEDGVIIEDEDDGDMHFIHDIVVTAFKPSDDLSGDEVIHLDGDITNNHVDNLKMS